MVSKIWDWWHTASRKEQGLCLLFTSITLSCTKPPWVCMSEWFCVFLMFVCACIHLCDLCGRTNFVFFHYFYAPPWPHLSLFLCFFLCLRVNVCWPKGWVVVLREYARTSVRISAHACYIFYLNDRMSNYFIVFIILRTRDKHFTRIHAYTHTLTHLLWPSAALQQVAFWNSSERDMQELWGIQKMEQHG